MSLHEDHPRGHPAFVCAAPPLRRGPPVETADAKHRRLMAILCAAEQTAPAISRAWVVPIAIAITAACGFLAALVHHFAP